MRETARGNPLFPRWTDFLWTDNIDGALGTVVSSQRKQWAHSPESPLFCFHDPQPKKQIRNCVRQNA